MFEFRYVELMNWAYWPTVRLPLDQQTIMITGPNGSGKTTFLDALRTLLRAPRLSSNRRFTDYVIGNVSTAVIKAVVTNESVGDEPQPFEFRGITSELVTLAAILSRRGGRWERRYAILKGDVALEDLRKLPKSDLLPPATYSYEIHEAGFSNALLKVLALEQGQTDKLCEKSPRELLDLLLDVHGDKEIIERYKRARENYQTASLEVSQLGARLAEEQAKVLSAQRAAERYTHYSKLLKERDEFENILIPQAEYKIAKANIAEANLGINDLQMRLGPLDREILSVQAQLENSDTEIEVRKVALEDAREVKVAAEREERDLDIRLTTLRNERQELQRLLNAVEDAKPEKTKPLQSRLEKAQRNRARLEWLIEDQKSKLQSMEADLEGLKTERRKIYPRNVDEFREVLSDSNIDHDLVCDLIDITDKRWQLAVESILGRDRFTVIVDSGDQQNARQLGERHRYRGYIVNADEGVPEGDPDASSDQAALAVVTLLDAGVPSWIIEYLDRTLLVESVQDGINLGRRAISVTRKGYKQDRRGGISIAVDHFYCGSLGQSAQRDELQKDLKRARKQLGTYLDQLEREQGTIDDLKRRLAVQDAIGKASEARERLEELDDLISAVNDQHHQSLEVKREAELKLLDTLDELNNFEHQLQEKRRWLLDKRGDQGEFLDEIKDFQKTIKSSNRQIQEIEGKLEPTLLSDRALKNVVELDELTPRYYGVLSLLEEYEDPPDETVVRIYEQYKNQFDEQKRIYSDHEAGLRNWHHEFHQARNKYIVVVEHTIREYRRNVLDLAELAGVNAEVAMPNLREAEDGLESAELVCRFGYDGKRADDVRGVSHSGGQRVISSLILLMALATSGGSTRGFFIIDEPFAHLSIERIDDVTRFLLKTQSQFILTSPTTHNVNVFNAARLQLNFRIKRPGADFAPIPTIIRR